MAKHSLGRIADKFDPRDFLAAEPPSVAPLPSSVDLRPADYVQVWPARDQQQQGSCTGHALVGAVELRRCIAGLVLLSLSPAFVYYEERVREQSTSDCDAGAMLRDGLGVLQHQGVCPEADDPYSDQRCGQPTAAAVQAALPLVIGAYHRCPTLHSTLLALSRRQPVVLGIDVYASFESDEAAKTGQIPLPAPGEELLGGHAILAVGYDQQQQVVRFRNSWSAAWGDNGYGTLPFAYVSSHQLCSDRWALV